MSDTPRTDAIRKIGAHAEQERALRCENGRRSATLPKCATCGGIGVLQVRSATDQDDGTEPCPDCESARPEALRTGWIPAETPPHKDGYYLAIRLGDHISEMCCHIFGDGKWRYGDGSECDDFPVTHWMPLPASPEEFMNTSEK